MVMFTCSILDHFLQVLSKISMWHFIVTWLISRQFTCRDVKLVAFLASNKRWKISSQQYSFWLPWLSVLGFNSKVFVQTVICYWSKGLPGLLVFFGFFILLCRTNFKQIWKCISRTYIFVITIRKDMPLPIINNSKFII